jgi:NAD+ diphosphatase
MKRVSVKKPQSQPLSLPLAGNFVERDVLARLRPKLFDELWGQPSTRVLAMYEGKVLLDNTNGATSLLILEVDRVPSAQARVYLGRLIIDTSGALGSAVVLAVLGKNAALALEPDESNWQTVRKTVGALSSAHAALVTEALAIANWHESHQYCAKCGTPTVVEQGGWVRRCFADEIELYPRTDPAVIVAITNDEDELLLGSQARWDANRWSIFAGFVEPGESAEAAVHREMLEETSLSLTDLSFVASQPWPYPCSLMLGFSARAIGNQKAKPDGDEIAKLEWFSRERLEKSAQEILLPPRGSISRAIIEHWFGGPILASGESR